VNRGVLLFRQGRYGDAIADLQQALVIKDDSFSAYLNLAEVYQAQHRWPEALAELNRALDKATRTAPQMLPLLYHTRAQHYILRKDYPAARPDLERAIQLEPEDSQSPRLAGDLVELARLQYRAKEYDEALDSCKKALGI